jgi:hypothetical protein
LGAGARRRPLLRFLLCRAARGGGSPPRSPPSAAACPIRSRVSGSGLLTPGDYT